MRLETVTKTDNRLQSVQVLRAIAFLLIFLSHAFVRLGWWGAFGVSLFIVLSGYLEAKHHLNDKLDVKIFAKKKVKKVYPIHIVTLILAIPLSLAILTANHGVIKLLAQIFFNVTMTQSWIPTSAIYYSLNAVSWYLTLVVFFALITPILMRWLGKSTSGAIAIVVTSLVILDFLIGFLSMRLPASHWIAYVCPVTRAFDYIIGGGDVCSAKAKAKEMDVAYRNSVRCCSSACIN